MIDKMKTVIERFSAAFAVLFIGVVAMNYIINLFVEMLGLLILEPLTFLRYTIIAIYVCYGLYHAATWYLQSQSKDQV